MNILITGGCGYIGSHLTHHLLKYGHNVTIVDDLSNAQPPLLWGEKVIEYDVGASGLKYELAQYNFDVVVHLAADKNAKSKYVLRNISDTMNVYRACIHNSIPLMINASSAAVYGNVDHVVSEFHKGIPVDNYGWSKLGAEGVLRDLAPRGITKVINLRLFNVAGKSIVPSANRMWSAEGVINDWAELIKGGSSILVNGGEKEGYPTRDFIHVEDVCAYFRKAMSLHLRGNDFITFNIGRGNPTSLDEVVEAFKDVVGVDFNVCKRNRIDEIKMSCADTDQTVQHLGRASKDIYHIVESSLI